MTDRKLFIPHLARIVTLYQGDNMEKQHRYHKTESCMSIKPDRKLMPKIQKLMDFNVSLSLRFFIPFLLLVFIFILYTNNYSSGQHGNYDEDQEMIITDDMQLSVGDYTKKTSNADGWINNIGEAIDSDYIGSENVEIEDIKQTVDKRETVIIDGISYSCYRLSVTIYLKCTFIFEEGRTSFDDDRIDFVYREENNRWHIWNNWSTIKSYVEQYFTFTYVKNGENHIEKYEEINDLEVYRIQGEVYQIPMKIGNNWVYEISYVNKITNKEKIDDGDWEISSAEEDITEAWDVEVRSENTISVTAGVFECLKIRIYCRRDDSIQIHYLAHNLVSIKSQEYDSESNLIFQFELIDYYMNNDLLNPNNSNNDVTIYVESNFRKGNSVENFFTLTERTIDSVYVDSDIQITIKNLEEIKNVEIIIATSDFSQSFREDLAYRSSSNGKFEYFINWRATSLHQFLIFTDAILKLPIGSLISEFSETQPDVYLTQVIVIDSHDTEHHYYFSEKLETSRDVINDILNLPHQEIITACPVDLIVEDSNGVDIIQKENVFYSGNNYEPEFYIIAYPQDSDYSISIIGKNDGTYSLIGRSIESGEVIDELIIEDIIISSGEVQTKSLHLEIPKSSVGGEENELFSILLDEIGSLPFIGYLGIVILVAVVSIAGVKKKKGKSGGVPLESTLSPTLTPDPTPPPAQPQYQQQPQYPQTQVPLQVQQQYYQPQVPQMQQQAPQMAPQQVPQEPYVQYQIPQQFPQVVQQVPMQSDGGWFCGKCGIKSQAEFQFCMSCGNKRGS